MHDYKKKVSLLIIWGSHLSTCKLLTLDFLESFRKGITKA
ncbi:hypothetical protein HMPREF0733_11748 [Rothia dentocariosa ATCC 17931]|uniref:Uncharacterized protein n=1 Tax=Rothia dentocariosa (strain ATCC 17931 / CDC X599 / XDIA) TaxID=762948 RepID=E3H1B7_ROTDC|nr:hypothetical protein HMPREF0733_11748 [Rothia dentocariosa ATCC 17931]